MFTVHESTRNQARQLTQHNVFPLTVNIHVSQDGFRAGNQNVKQ